MNLTKANTTLSLLRFTPVPTNMGLITRIKKALGLGSHSKRNHTHHSHDEGIGEVVEDVAEEAVEGVVEGEEEGFDEESEFEEGGFEDEEEF